MIRTCLNNGSSIEEITNDIGNQLKRAKELSLLIEKEKSKLPYNYNIIDELHANENAHTRILLQILRYKQDGKYPYLISFLNMMKQYSPEFPIEKVSSPNIEFNKEFIDGLIEEKCKYGVILENKIDWANDRDNQLISYYEKVNKHGIEKSCIFIIYLTSDGSKKVGSNSLPNNLRRNLGNRFIELNYHDDILPWLQNDILPEIKLKEQLIESGVKQYIDYLKGRFNLRDSQKPIRQTMKQYIKKILNINDNASLNEQWNTISNNIENVNKLITAMQYVKDELTQNVFQTIDTETAKQFGENNFRNSILKGNYYQIFCEGINHSVHFEWIPLTEGSLFNETTYKMVLHIESDDKINQMEKLIRNDVFTAKAEQYGYRIIQRGNEFMSKDYSAKEAFALLSNNERISFLTSAYKEVKDLRKILEDTHNLLKGESSIISNLTEELNAKTNNNWSIYNKWDIATSFNDSTSKIGIEASFSIREDKTIVFKTYITVWDKKNWEIYQDRVSSHFSGATTETANRKYLHLPGIEIGRNLEQWRDHKHEILNYLFETYKIMEEIT